MPGAATAENFSATHTASSAARRALSNAHHTDAPAGCGAEHDQDCLLADRVDNAGAALFAGDQQQAGRGAQARGQICRVGGFGNEHRHRRAMEHGDMDDLDQESWRRAEQRGGLRGKRRGKSRAGPRGKR